MRHASRAVRLPRPLLGLLALLIVLAPGAARADEALEKLLFDGRHLLRVRHDPESALERFDEVLRHEPLEPRLKGEALWGAGECHAALGSWAKAKAAWETLLHPEEGFPEELRGRAEKALKQREQEEQALAPAGGPEASSSEALAERERRRMQQVEQLLGRARAAFDARRFDDARRDGYEALALDPENSEASRLLELVERERPDRGELIRSLLRLYETGRSESYQRLKTRLRELEEQGQRRQSAGDAEGADLSFREAIALVDRSEFRAELDTERWNLLFWLRQVETEGRAKGLTFPPEPVPPAGPPAEAGLRGRFYALLGETFSGRDEGAADPIRFHEFAPLPSTDGTSHRALGPNAFASRNTGVEQSAGSLSRARFAERYVRATVASDWPTRSAADGRAPPRRPAAAPAPRILERLGDTLFVQHTEAVQHEIEALRTSFAPRPPPVQVDVSLYAAGPGGTVRSATALRLGAPPARESGLDAVVAGRLIEECRKDLAQLENVTLLGSAQVKLTGDVGAMLEITERTETHPLHALLPEPPLTIPGLEAARYGLWLDLYGEDLPGARKGPRSAALSVVARARLALPSVVLRKADRGGDWSRLPKFAQTVVEADRRLPHASTLALFGLPNPFADSAASFPDLIVLLAVRPAPEDGRQAPLPDPPPWQPPGKGEAQEHPLGPLATEVEDDLVLDGWPEHRSAASPPTEPVARQARDEYLAGLLAGRARLLTPHGPNPVSVHEGLAQAVAGAREHVLLAAAVAWLAAQENALYDLDLRAFEVVREASEPFTQRAGVTPLPVGEAWVVPAAQVGQLDAELTRAQVAPSRFALSARQAARATQQVVQRRLQSHSITRQVRVARSAKDQQQRLVPVTGLAEEGLILQLRPGAEEDGRRVTTLRVRAASLRAIESVPLRGVELPGVAVDVPRWHPLQDRSVAAALADGEALVLRLPCPSDPTHVLLVRVVTRRLQ